MGDEEARIIAPAVAALRAEGIDVRGPAAGRHHVPCRAPAPAMTRRLCMYHDQALMPVKTLDFDEAVNVTLGLPFVRTSPDHGTALDIAGQGRGRPDSLIAAIELAAAMARSAPGRHGASMTTPAPLRLGVNLDHVATLRNARGGAHPDPVRFAQLAVEAGADGITVHLREDRRHIRDARRRAADGRARRAPLNLEMAVTAEMVGDRPPAAAARHLPGAREAAPR